MAKLPTVKKAIEISDNPAAFVSYDIDDAIITLCNRGLSCMIGNIIHDSMDRVKVLRAELVKRGLRVEWDL
jgi:hypothetical protein